MAIWESLNLDGLEEYKYSITQAKQELIKDKWIYNEDGEEYDDEKNKIRFKKLEGEEKPTDVILEKLTLSIIYPEEEENKKLLTDNLVKNLEEAGFEVKLIPKTIEEIAEDYMTQDITSADMYYLGNNFDISLDITSIFREGETEEYEEGTLLWTHTKLHNYSIDMCETEPQDVLGFVGKWITVQEKIMELLPVIPVYGNVYIDFYTKRLNNYNIYKNTTWAEAIVDCYLNEIDEEMKEEKPDYNIVREDINIDD